VGIETVWVPVFHVDVGIDSHMSKTSQSSRAARTAVDPRSSEKSRSLTSFCKNQRSRILASIKGTVIQSFSTARSVEYTLLEDSKTCLHHNAAAMKQVPIRVKSDSENAPAGLKYTNHVNFNTQKQPLTDSRYTGYLRLQCLSARRSSMKPTTGE
jgi:hypothetical protein